MIDLRLATSADYEAIVSLVTGPEELFRIYPRGEYPFSVRQLQTLAEQRREFTVAVHESEVVGFANLYDITRGQRAFIGNVIVSGTHRGKGIGRTLVRHMAGVAFENYGLPEVCISVFSENSPALLLYAGLNFHPYAVEERRDPAGRRVALIHMVLRREEWGDASLP